MTQPLFIVVFEISKAERGSLQLCQDLLGVGVGLDLGHDGFNNAIFINDKRGAHHAHTDLSAHLLFLPNAVGFNSLTVGIGQRGISREVC